LAANELCEPPPLLIVPIQSTSYVLQDHLSLSLNRAADSKLASPADDVLSCLNLGDIIFFGYADCIYEGSSLESSREVKNTNSPGSLTHSNQISSVVEYFLRILQDYEFLIVIIMVPWRAIICQGIMQEMFLIDHFMFLLTGH